MSKRDGIFVIVGMIVVLLLRYIGRFRMPLALARTLPPTYRGRRGGFGALVGYADRVPIPRMEISGS